MTFLFLQEGIKIFSEETIYHLGDRYVEYIKDYKKKKQDEFRHVAVFPCKLKIIPDVSTYRNCCISFISQIEYPYHSLTLYFDSTLIIIFWKSLQAIFNKRDPIVLGVTVENGILRTGTPLCVPSKEVMFILNFVQN